MDVVQQAVDCVSGTGTKFKTDILNFFTTKQHNNSNQHRTHSVSNNKPTKPCFRCASTDHTAYECKYKTYNWAYCKKRLVIFSQIVLLRKIKSKEAKQCQPF